jgi:hypothetical protein
MGGDGVMGGGAPCPRCQGRGRIAGNQNSLDPLTRENLNLAPFPGGSGGLGNNNRILKDTNDALEALDDDLLTPQNRALDSIREPRRSKPNKEIEETLEEDLGGGTTDETTAPTEGRPDEVKIIPASKPVARKLSSTTH